MSAPPYLHEWLESANALLPVIDVRSHDNVYKRHISGAAHIPLDEWNDRSLEFPPRKHSFLLLAPAEASLTTEQAHTLGRILATAGTDCASVIHDDGSASASSFWSRVPPHLVRLEQGWVTSEQARLWQPSPLAPTLLAILHAATTGAGAGGGSGDEAGVSAPECAALRLLDAGAGTGRNAVYLQQEWWERKSLTTPGLHVTAVDNRRAMCEKLVKFAARALPAAGGPGPGGGGGGVEVVQKDILPFLGSLGQGQGFHVAAFFRFLDWPALTACLPVLTPWPTPCAHTTGVTTSCAGHVWVLLEHFHASSPHPKEEGQKVREGQLLAHLQEASRSSPAPPMLLPLPWRLEWRVLHECLSLCEDGRPMLHVIAQACCMTHT